MLTAPAAEAAMVVVRRVALLAFMLWIEDRGRGPAGGGGEGSNRYWWMHTKGVLQGTDQPPVTNSNMSLHSDQLW
jgi:hypothetical protein